MRKASARRDQPIPSLTGRAAKGTEPPPNIIPFTKPRAISQMAAANPLSVVMTPSKPAPVQEKLVDTAARNMALAARQNLQPTGWTPPRGVKAIAPTNAPAAPVKSPSPAAPVTVYPASPAVQIASQNAPTKVMASVAPMASISSSMTAQSIPVPMQQPLTAPPAEAPAMPKVPVAAPAPVLPAAPTPDANPWAVYEQLGLGAPKVAPAVTPSQKFGKLIVNAYRLLGFGILTIIVVVLVGYIASTAFFYVSSSWVVPMQVSAQDERVITLQAQLADQESARDRIVDELNQAERAIAAQQQFQGEFAKAIKSDLDGRKAALGRIRSLANAAASTRAAIKNQNQAFASSSRRKMADEYAAGLIDRSTMLSGKFQLAQISTSNLSLAERQAEFETRAADLEAQTRSMDAMLTSNREEATGQDVALSYEVLRIKQEYEASKLDLAKSIEARETTKAALERQDKILAALKQSAYIRAVADGASVAFIPYANLPNVKKGTGLYACKVGMVFCYHVGVVLEVLPGEVQFKHPQRDKMLRGQMIELKLDTEDADAASDDVLFLGGKPLLL
ncbi:MAG: hypothetical protein H0T89_34335 [Deltaproteobacteria bacterium]|nr:hypothetical protein [Deltaproteobacteria bacterium]MDQ3297954.1 hypothetical protein [Myxococcota bacterium]